MNNLFKLTFTPIVNGYKSINKYKVKVEYFDKNVVGTMFDMRGDDRLGFVIFFNEEFINAFNHCIEGYCGETITSRSLIGDGYTIEKRYIDLYIEAINKVKPQLKEVCLEKQRKEDCLKKTYEEWKREKPIEYSF